MELNVYLFFKLELHRAGPDADRAPESGTGRLHQCPGQARLGRGTESRAAGQVYSPSKVIKQPQVRTTRITGGLTRPIRA